MMRIIDKLRGLRREPEPFDPSHFDDPVATKTPWTPAKSGGANFRTHKLVQVNEWRLAFQATLGLKLFCFVFISFGIVPLIFFLKQSDTTGNDALSSLVLILAFGLLFAVIGGVMLFVGLKPRVFDRSLGFYWRGYKGPGTMYNPDEYAKFTSIGKIHAIQIIKERCRSKNGSYYSYELNLVLDDASRINVIDHGNGSILSDDADKLAQFLDVPVWPAI